MRPALERFNGWRRGNLTRRIALPAIVTTLLFLAALGFVAFRLGQRAVLEQIDARNRQLAVQVSGEIATFFQTQLDTVRLQSDRLLAADPAEQGLALVRLRAQFPYVYNDLRLYDATGRETLSAAGRLGEVMAQGATAPAAPGAPDPSVQRALASRAIELSPVGFRPITGTPFVTATLPLLGCAPDTTPCAAQGAIQAQIDLRSFWTRVDGISIEDGAVTIVDGNGLVIAHPDRRQVGTHIAVETIAPLFEGYEGSTSYMRGGETYLAAYAPVGSPLGWGVTVEQERDAALRLVGTIGWATTLATLLSAVALALLLSSLTGRALRPVGLLSQAAAGIAAGADLHSVADVRAPAGADSAELVTLADSFNQMIARLRAAHDHMARWNEELEHRVDERTAQLQTVLEVARMSGGSLEKEAVLATILAQIGRLVEYDAATIRLLDATGEQLGVAAAAGEGSADLPRRITLDGSIFAPVLRERAARLVPNTAAEDAWQATFGVGFIPGSWLGVPLVAQERPLGVLSVYATGTGRYGAEQAEILSALGAQVAVTLSHARLYEESVRRVEDELRTARQIQKHLFPERAPTLSGLDIATFYRPARETTGDFYSFITPGRQSDEDDGYGRDVVDLFIGDVSGKSLPAALLMTMARTALYAAASGAGGGPVQTLRRANDVLMGDIPRGSFVASTFARLDRQAGTCTLVNAAQPAPLLVRDGRATLLEGPGDHLPLGVVAAPAYEPLSVRLRPGDLLLFYTDGVIEAFSPAGELFGFERLEQTLIACGVAPAHAVLDEVMAAVRRWMGQAPQHDDIAILAVRISEGWG